jgi:hypothetical protein
MNRILIFVYGELKFEEMKLCGLLCKIPEELGCESREIRQPLSRFKQVAKA